LRPRERTWLCLPLLVSSTAGDWREFTESRDVHQFGMGLRLMHPVELGMRLRAKLPMPASFRIRQTGKRLYTVSAVIRHATSLPDGANLIGVEYEAVLDD